MITKFDDIVEGIDRGGDIRMMMTDSTRGTIKNGKQNSSDLKVVKWNR